MTAEHQRLAANAAKKVPLAKWGPYLSERQWGTVREDYSHHGNAWEYFPFDQAHCRAYQWGEDGIGGISDIFQNLCFAVSLWNGKDPILKERLFGLRNGEGNHGEDVKELYYYLDNLPTHYYMEFLYKYPQKTFPYDKLRDENRHRSRHETEYEILDTGVFDNNQYFDVLITYAKQSDTDIFIKIDITNRYSKPASINVLPTLWFYNRGSNKKMTRKPSIHILNKTSVKAMHGRMNSDYYFYFQPADAVLFTNNETNTWKVNGTPTETIFTKDAFHDAIIRGENLSALRKKRSGTKFAPVYKLKVPAGATKTLYCRLSDTPVDAFPRNFQQIFSLRKQEANDFYAAILPKVV